MEIYKLNHDDIQFTAEQIMNLLNSGNDFNAETIAQEIMASLIVCNVKNGG